MDLVLMRDVGRRCIQTLPNRRSPTQSRRISRQIPPSQKSRGILTPSYTRYDKPLKRANELRYLRLPIHTTPLYNDG